MEDGVHIDGEGIKLMQLARRAASLFESQSASWTPIIANQLIFWQLLFLKTARLLGRERLPAAILTTGGVSWILFELW